MQEMINKVEAGYRKKQVTDVRSGDTVRVHQKIQEGKKTRTQVFEGLVIRTRRKNSLTSSITVRRIASGVGVEKTYLLHSPLIQKVEVVKRSKVRRKNLSYMRERGGKSARLASVDFDKDAVNIKDEPAVPEDESKAAKEAKAHLETEIREEKVVEEGTEAEAESKAGSEATKEVEKKAEDTQPKNEPKANKKSNAADEQE